MPVSKSRLRELGVEEDGSPWRTQEVEVVTVVDGGRERNCRVTARVYGSLAVHPGACKFYDGQWVITHLPTGMVVANVAAERDALRLGEALWSAACLALQRGSAIEVRAALPGWVIGWLAMCRTLGQYLDPSPFRKEGGK